MARTKKNASSKASSNTKKPGRPPKQPEQPKEEGTLMKATRNVSDVIGGAISKTSEATLIYGLGGFAFFAISSYFGLGLIGVLLVAAAVWAAIEICYMLFSKQEKYAVRREKVEELGDSMKNLTRAEKVAA